MVETADSLCGLAKEHAPSFPYRGGQIQLPLRPFLATVGVAPRAEREAEDELTVRIRDHAEAGYGSLPQLNTPTAKLCEGVPSAGRPRGGRGIGDGV